MTYWSTHWTHQGHLVAFEPLRPGLGVYRLHVSHPDGERTLVSGLAGAGRLVETLCTMLDSRGAPVPLDVREVWLELARMYDESTARAQA